MPLHDWTDRPGWYGFHLLWISELLRWVKPRLPDGYRAYVGSTPTVGIGAPEHADVSVREWHDPVAAEHKNGPPVAVESPEAPDEEVAVATLETSPAIIVLREGRLVAAIELVSPRNKDRQTARDAYAGKYLGYLLQGVHLVLIDVHRRPVAFSFAERLAQELGIEQPKIPAPFALAYRVGERTPAGGSFLALWRRPLEAGQPLPHVPLPLNVEQAVSLNLDETYQNAARDAYLA